MTAVVRQALASSPEIASLRNEMTQLREQVTELTNRVPPRLVDVAEAAQSLSCSPATIRRLIKSRQLRSVRVGRLVRVDLSGIRPSDTKSVAMAAAQARGLRVVRGAK